MAEFIDPRITFRFRDTGAVKLHCAEMGEGSPVILLHGFPELWYSWRAQIPVLADAGYHVIAPDMRGYNLSDKPKGIAAYQMDKLTADVAGLIRSLGAQRAVVAGHDWGAAVAWSFAMQYPEMLERLVILNVPHPFVFLKALKTFRQLRKSWYIFYFQLPWLPEMGFRAGNFRAVRNVFRHDPVRKGAFSEADIERYVEAAAQPGALTATINYYRAMLRANRAQMRASARVIEAPVLVLWGEQDRYIEPELADPDPKWVPNARVVRYPDASHWLQADKPDEVNRQMLAFLAEQGRC